VKETFLRAFCWLARQSLFRTVHIQFALRISRQYKFNSPIVANGKVYIGTGHDLDSVSWDSFHLLYNSLAKSSAS
jgi:hypothetical protein